MGIVSAKMLDFAFCYIKGHSPCVGPGNQIVEAGLQGGDILVREDDIATLCVISELVHQAYLFSLIVQIVDEQHKG